MAAPVSLSVQDKAAPFYSFHGHGNIEGEENGMTQMLMVQPNP